MAFDANGDGGDFLNPSLEGDNLEVHSMTCKWLITMVS